MIDHVGTEGGIPYFDDLYLDLIVVPGGKLIEKDIDEIEAALAEGEITKQQYDKAWTTFEKLKREIEAGDLALLHATEQHFLQLFGKNDIDGIK